MAQLAGATLTTHATFRPDNTVNGYRGPAIDNPVWLAMTEVYSHGGSVTHTTNVRNTLADTDVETGVAELDQFTNVAIVAPTEVNVTPSLKGLASAIGLQGAAFPGAGGHTTEDEAGMQHAEAFRQYQNETGLDLIATFTNVTDLSGATLSMDGFADVKTAAKTNKPIGSQWHSIMNVNDFAKFLKDAQSSGNARSALAQPLAEMRLQGYEGIWEGVHLFSSNDLDQHDATHWKGALVCGVSFDPNVYPSATPLGGVDRPSGLIGGPARMTVVEFLDQKNDDLASDQRLGSQKITYSYYGLVVVDNKQAEAWISDKT